MKRLLFTTVSVISLILCLLTTGIWVRSYFVADTVDWMTPGGTFGYVWSANGSASYHTRSYSVYGPGIRSAPWFRWRVGPVILPVFSPGVMSDLVDRPHAPPPPALPEMNLEIPYWMPALLLGVSPFFWFWARRRRERRQRMRARLRLCQGCGYDLRASQGACPECGAAIPVEAGVINRL